jgi:membrane fusion protein, multidrug efflux system
VAENVKKGRWPRRGETLDYGATPGAARRQSDGTPMDDRPGDIRPPASPSLRERFRPLPLQRPSRQRVIWIALGLLLLAALAWIIFRSHTSASRAPRATAPMAVVTAEAQQGDMPVTINGLGTVTSLAMVTVRTQINGQLIQIAFQEGQEVNKGDFLAEIDPRPYQAALDQAQGQLQRDQAQLTNARRDLVRFNRLVAENSIAQQQRDTQEALVHQLEGTVATDQGLVDNAKLNLAYCHIVAPVSGRVGLRQVDAGNYVQVSDPNGIVVITQLKPISAIFSLPEDNLQAIMKRLNAGATLQVTAFDRSGVAKLATGALVTVDNQIDPTTGTVKLRAQFDNNDEALFPNQFVNVQLLVDTLQGVTLLPSAAIQRGAPGTFVYVVKPGDTVSVQAVKLGPGDGERVAVASGIAAGDTVVVDGADKLREGAKVTLPGTAGAARPADGRPGARGNRATGK